LAALSAATAMHLRPWSPWPGTRRDCLYRHWDSIAAKWRTGAGKPPRSRPDGAQRNPETNRAAL